MGIEILERAAEGDGRVLRVEQLAPAGGSTDPTHGPGYLLTFDVGRVLVAAVPTTGSLLIRNIEAEDDIGAQLTLLDEEEPWWRVAGNAISRVWPETSGAGAEAGGEHVRGVRLQFRKDDDNPRIVSLRFEDAGVRVNLEAADGQ
jgi:hypothetical protein